MLTALFTASAASAGSIYGSVYDASTGQPLSNIDIDLFDIRFQPVDRFGDGPGSTPNDNTAADGSFRLDSLLPGEYFVLADPSAAQGYVGQYFPGVFLQSQAQSVVVREAGETSTDFHLERGATLSGQVVDATTLAPLAGVDIDLYAWDGSFIGSIDAETDAGGTYTLRALPQADFYVKADPHGAGMYLPQFYAGALSLDGAQAVTVPAGGMTGVDFKLVPGGAIGGTVTARDSGAPLPGIDIDVFDADGRFIDTVNASTDSAGTYWLGALPEGNYFVQADPSAAQLYLDTWYGDTSDMSAASRVAVSAGVVAAGTSITLPPGGSIAGTVTRAVDGAPLEDVQIIMLDATGTVRVASARTDRSGTYMVGAAPSGDYILRCSGVEALGLAFEYHTDAVVASEADSIRVTAGAATSGIDFALEAGGWICGRVTNATTGHPMADVGLDLFTTTGKQLKNLDTVSDAGGDFCIGPVPAGAFVVRAVPGTASGFPPLYYNGAASLENAVRIQVTGGSRAEHIDFAFGEKARREHAPRQDLAAEPNPFNPMTTISFALPAAGPVRLTIHDARGRVVAVLADGDLPAGRHDFVWDGRTSAGRKSSSGVHFLRLETPARVEKRKLILLE